jgi:ribosomal protein S18 acetylase RimI-like enzyme
MIFRDYHPEDFSEVFRLWEELEMAPAERGDNQDTILKTLKNGGKLIVLAEPETGKIIGSSWMTFDGRRIFLHHFGIKKGYRRKGWGEKLALESLKFITEKGCQVKLEVHQDNLPAIKLYEKMGFESFPDYGLYMIRKVHEIDRSRLG